MYFNKIVCADAYIYTWGGGIYRSRGGRAMYRGRGGGHRWEQQGLSLPRSLCPPRGGGERGARRG